MPATHFSLGAASAGLLPAEDGLFTYPASGATRVGPPIAGPPIAALPSLAPPSSTPPSTAPPSSTEELERLICTAMAGLCHRRHEPLLSSGGSRDVAFMDIGLDSLDIG